jgi:hypothetical protein
LTQPEEFALIFLSMSEIDTGRFELCQQMHVVGHAADFEQDSAFSANYAAHVRVKICAEFLSDERIPAFGAKNDVIEKICVGASHDKSSIFLRRYAASRVVCTTVTAG